jgi:hypothetical protein
MYREMMIGSTNLEDGRIGLQYMEDEGNSPSKFGRWEMSTSYWHNSRIHPFLGIFFYSLVSAAVFTVFCVVQ